MYCNQMYVDRLNSVCHYRFNTKKYKVADIYDNRYSLYLMLIIYTKLLFIHKLL